MSIPPTMGVYETFISIGHRHIKVYNNCKSKNISKAVMQLVNEDIQIKKQNLMSDRVKDK